MSSSFEHLPSIDKVLFGEKPTATIFLPLFEKE